MNAATGRFPSLDWFRALADQLNADREFRHLARWTDARIGFLVDEAPTIVFTVVAGKISRVEVGEGLHGVDYALSGPREGWDAMFSERGSLTLATNQLHGRLRVTGDLVLAAGDRWTLASICRRFRQTTGESWK